MNNPETLINWYPGHMAKAMREIKQSATLADIFIIVLDARCPISSYNEDFDLIAPQKPRLFVITKSDLMDKNKKDKIAHRFGNDKLLWLDLRQNKSKNIILKEIKKLSKDKVKRNKDKGLLMTKIKVFVLGIPNAGKSTLINLMLGKKSLKVANFPGVTKVKKWANFENYHFMDTPGILLPKLENQEAATKLAMVGSIETKIFPLTFLVYNFLKILNNYYPEKLKQEFEINNIDNELDEIKLHNIINAIALKKNFKQNNKIDLGRTYKFIINWIKDLKNVTYD